MGTALTETPTVETAKEAVMDIPRESLFVAVANGYWGKGATLAEAARKACDAGAANNATACVYAYVGYPVDLAEIGVNGMGDICYPLSCDSIRLFGPQTKITLRQMINDKTA